jgi:hypothetical protein
VAYDFYISLVQFAGGDFQANPTLATGDFQVSKDGGAFANLASLPTVSPALGVSVRVALDATEMTADKIMVTAIDAAGDEWVNVSIFLDVPEDTAQTAADIMEGDHIETSTRLIINRKGTSVALVDKDITGSLLTPNVTIRTLDH